MAGRLEEYVDVTTTRSWAPIALNALAVCCLTIIVWLTSIRAKHFCSTQTRQPVEYITFVLLVSSAFFVGIAVPIATTHFLTPTQCMISLIGCLMFYGLAKFLAVILLVEKAFLVNKGLRNIRRRDHPLYQVNSILLLIYVILLTRLTIHSGYKFEGNDCRLSFGESTVTPLVVYDIAVGMYLTALFVVPLARSMKVVGINVGNREQVQTVQKTMKVCLVAAFFTALSSSVNLGSFNILNWQWPELCISICCIDVTVNSVAAHFITPLPRGRNLLPLSSRSSQIRVDHSARLAAAQDTWATKKCKVPRQCSNNAEHVQASPVASHFIDEDESLFGLSGV